MLRTHRSLEDLLCNAGQSPKEDMVSESEPCSVVLKSHHYTYQLINGARRTLGRLDRFDGIGPRPHGGPALMGEREKKAIWFSLV
jgi:hypothetical protein